MADSTSKRLSPEQRKTEILLAARRLLGRQGLTGFSLEAVAREAGVAASLPRHYFGGHVDLLQAATAEVLEAVETALLTPDPAVSTEARLAAYLDVLTQHPWGHALWMRSAEFHPDTDAVVRQARRRMAEALSLRPWNKLSRQQQIHARGLIGFVEAVVTDWIERGMSDREVVIATMAQALRNLRMPEESTARRTTPKAVGSSPKPRRR